MQFGGEQMLLVKSHSVFGLLFSLWAPRVGHAQS